MARMMVDLDPALVEEARALAGARTKREAIERALREFVRRERLKGLAARAGQVPFALSWQELHRLRD
jgi:Arc/MetJ family transcription regulator